MTVTYIRIEVSNGVINDVKSSSDLDELKTIDESFSPESDDIQIYEMDGDEDNATHVWSHPNIACVKCDKWIADDEKMEYKGDPWHKDCHTNFIESLK